MESANSRSATTPSPLINPEQRSLCNEIIKRGLKIEWNCGTRVDMLTKELLVKMKNAGCITVWFGVESGSQQVLDAMKKGITPELTMKVFGWLSELGMTPIPNVILGFPGETKESAWKTIRFIEKISPHDTGFYNVATPFPGTPMYDKVKEKGWLQVTDFDMYDTCHPIFETPTMSMKELSKLRQAAYMHFYLREDTTSTKEEDSNSIQQWLSGTILYAYTKLKLRK